MSRRDRDADRSVDDDRLPAELDRAAQLAEDPLRGRGRLLLGDDVDQEDRELVTALAADDVALADGAGQALRDLAQDVVANRVAERVVDPLEVVEVHEQQGDAARLASLASEGALEVIAQQHAVGEARQGIVQRVVDQLGLQALAVGRVDEEALRDATAAAGVVRHRERLVAEPHLGAVSREHPVLRPERRARLPVIVVGGDGGGSIVGMDAARP